MGYSLSNAVGLNDDLSFAANLAADQQQVAELLMMIPLINGGLKTSSGVIQDIPTPFVEGYAPAELVDAIQTFQTIHGAYLNVDLRVEPDSPTLEAMVAHATASTAATDPISNVTLDTVNLVIEETEPIPVSGLPAIAYKLVEAEHLVFATDAFRVTVSFSGVLTASWGNTFGLACTAKPSFAQLDQAVKSGQAASIGATALDQACSELKASTRTAAYGLFSQVSLSMDALGQFKMGGSIGDKYRQFSLSFEFPGTVKATGSVVISEDVPVSGIGGTVKFTGTLACTIKVTSQTPGLDEASILANLAVVLIAGSVILLPAAEWMAGAETWEGALTVIRSAAQGLKEEFVLLSPQEAGP